MTDTGNIFAALRDLQTTDVVLDSPADDRARSRRQQGGEEPAAEASTSARQSEDGGERAALWAAARERYKLRNPIVWMDLEMTGLEPDTHHILEIAVLITDGDLTGPHLEGPDIAIHQSEEVLAGMNEWCVKNHGQSGLTQRCRESGVSLAQAEEQVLAFLEQHTQPMAEPGPGEVKAHLAGNSIYVDRQFLQRHMPRVHAHLHWRLVDVSTVLELCRRWYPAELRRAPKKKVLHTAMADIRESLAELKYYRKAIFKEPQAKAQPGTGTGARDSPAGARRGRRGA